MLSSPDFTGQGERERERGEFLVKTGPQAEEDKNVRQLLEMCEMCALLVCTEVWGPGKAELITNPHSIAAMSR